MKVLLAIAPERFRDEEFAEPAAALDKAGISYDIASVRAGPCTGMLGAKVYAGAAFEDVNPRNYDGLVIVGGSGSQDFLWENSALVRLAIWFSETNRVVSAICLAPVVLSRPGILKGKNATVYESQQSVFEMKKGRALLRQEPVVKDGRIITANGPDAAKDFAAAVVAELRAGPGTAAPAKKSGSDYIIS